MTKMKNAFSFFFALFSLLAACSCGFVGEEPISSKELYTSAQMGNCNIDGEAFSKIMDEDIDQAILCLEQSFNDFSSNVESDDKTLLNKGQISLFIEKFMDNQKDSIIKALDLLFKVNMLILKDHPNYISSQNFKNITKLLLVTNRSAVQMKKIYDTIDRTSASKELIASKRIVFKETIEYFSRNIVTIINSAIGQSQGLNLSDLINDLKELTKDDRLAFDMDQVNNLLALKTVLVGGSKEILTTDEVILLFKNLPTMAMVVYDAYYAREDHFSDLKLGLYRFYGELVDHFKTIFNDRNKSELLFDKDDSIKIADFIADYDDEDEIDRNKARGMVDAFFVLKQHAISPDPMNIVVADIDKLSFYAKMVLESVASISEISETLDQEIPNRAKRQTIATLINSAKQQLRDIFDNRNINIGTIDLSKLLNDLKKVVAHYKLDFDIEQIEDLLPLKKMVCGGEKNKLQDNDLDRLINKVDTITLIAFDMAYSEKSDFSDQEIGLYHLFSDAINRVQTIFEGRPQQEEILGQNEAYKIAHFLANRDLEDDLNEDQARGLIDAFFAFKRQAIGNTASLTVKDIKTLVFYARILMESTSRAITISDILDQDSEETISPSRKAENRKRIEQILEDGQSQLLSLFREKTFTLPSFDLLSLVSAIKDGIEKAELGEIDFELVKKLVPLKKIILGGSRTDFTDGQLKILIEKLPTLALIGTDLTQFDSADYKNDEDKMGFFIDTVRSGKSVIHNFSDDSKELIYSINELVSTIDYATDNEYNVSKFADSIETLVVKFLHGTSNRFTIKDIKTLLNYAEELTESVYYNSLAFEYNQSVLSSLNRVRATALRVLPIKNQSKLDAKRLATLHNEFAILIEKLYLYRTKEGQQYTGHDIIRTKYGLNEAGMARFGVKKLLEAYCPSSNTNPLTCGVDGEILNKFLHDFKSLLVEYNLWSTNMKTFASNVLYLADLFQTQSNGDQRIGLDEGVEYVGLILTAVKMANEVTDGLVKRCGNYTQGSVEEQEANPTIELSCFRKNVIDVWMNELGYKQYMAAFSRYFNETSFAEMQEYISYLEQFVHENKDENFMRIRDITLFIGAIQNVESMLIRFDVNRNNFLDPAEVDQAFGVYESLIVDLGGLSGSKRKYAKSAFLFMVKEMKFPSTSDVLTFHYNPFVSKNISAHRINVASILYYFTTL